MQQETIKKQLELVTNEVARFHMVHGYMFTVSSRCAFTRQ